MVGDNDSEILDRSTKGVVAPPDGAAEEILLELGVSPGPAELGLDRTVGIIFERCRVGLAGRRRRNRGILPERGPRPKPDEAVEAFGIRFWLEALIGTRVEHPALDVVLHPLV